MDFQPISPRGRHNLYIGGRCGRRWCLPEPFVFRILGSAFDPWDPPDFSPQPATGTLVPVREDVGLIMLLGHQHELFPHARHPRRKVRHFTRLPPLANIQLRVIQYSGLLSPARLICPVAGFPNRLRKRVVLGFWVFEKVKLHKTWHFVEMKARPARRLNNTDLKGMTAGSRVAPPWLGLLPCNLRTCSVAA